jgi:hypothetical protein
MGKVSIWRQRLLVAAGVLLSPVFVLFVAWFLRLAPRSVGYGRTGRQYLGRLGGLGQVRVSWQSSPSIGRPESPAGLISITVVCFGGKPLS